MRILYKILNLSKVLRRSPQDYILLFQAFSLLTAIRLGLFLLPFRILLGLLRTISYPATHTSAKGMHAVKTIVWAVEVSSRYTPGGAKCLARALTAKVLLNWHGYAPDLKIGVAKSNGGTLEAHAWIEHQGQVVIGRLKDLSKFIPLSQVQE